MLGCTSITGAVRSSAIQSLCTIRAALGPEKSPRSHLDLDLVVHMTKVRELSLLRAPPADYIGRGCRLPALKIILNGCTRLIGYTGLTSLHVNNCRCCQVDAESWSFVKDVKIVRVFIVLSTTRVSSNTIH